MATERQIAANIRNAAFSTGPKTPEGKAVSRGNALKHGLAGNGVVVANERAEQLAERKTYWHQQLRPDTYETCIALDLAADASVRLDHCRESIQALTSANVFRAHLTWDEDRRIEAAVLFESLHKRPLSVSCQLRATRHGAELLIEAWTHLGVALEAGDWSEAQAALALDMLGVRPEFRGGRTVIDAKANEDIIAHRRALVQHEIETLEQLKRDSLIPLDEVMCEQAKRSHLVLLSKPAALLLRYQREAYNQFVTMLQVAKTRAVELAPRESAPDQPAEIVEVPSPVSVSVEEDSEEDAERQARAAYYLDLISRRREAAGSPSPVAEPVAETSPPPARSPGRRLNRPQRRALAARERKK